MDPTIYTFGDPMIVREALLALATIFDSSEWVDGGNGFGLGGNLLAAALIGLLGILIAGINTQTMRVDYLLTAFILFAITFSAKTDVNVEDIQTGDTTVVADVPLGVAWVAGLASATAYDLTETVSTALQRPGSETSVLTTTGFLNPLKELLILRGMSLQELDPFLYSSVMAYYRFCIGKTQENSPGTWEMYAFMNDPDPWLYFVDDANVQNWTTIYYDDANPGGVAQGCHLANDNMNDRMLAIAGGTTDEAERYIRRMLGADQYNTNFDLASIESAIDLMFRAGVASTEFMSNQLMANMHNAGEAWKLAEYGDNKAQYVATLTEAFEQKAVQSAAEGSIFLQYMFPLMGFFQFVFFALPPFIVLIMIASPVQSPKILGFYLLFGVWCYGWLPIAAVINHYMQISVQNEIEFAGLDLVGTYYTAINGFDSLYTIIATKLVIGANALAATPVILAALLMGTPFAIGNIAQRLGRGGSVNTGIGAPKLLDNGPLMKRSAMASAAVGARIGEMAVFAAASEPQKQAYGKLGVQRTLASAASRATSAADQARSSVQSRSAQGARYVESIVNGAEVESGQRQRAVRALSNAVSTGYKQILTADERESLVGQKGEQVRVAAQAAIFGNGATASSVDTSNFSDTQTRALSKLKENSSAITANAMDELANTGSLETEVESRLMKEAGQIRELSKAAEQSENFAEEMRETASAAYSSTRLHSLDTTDLARTMLGRNNRAFESIMAAATGAGIGNEVASLAQQRFAESTPVGLDGKKDLAMDQMDRVSTALLALEEMAATDSRAAQAYVGVLRQQGGIMLDEMRASTTEGWSATDNVGTDLDARGSQIQSGVKSQIGAVGGRVASDRDAVREGASKIQGAASTRENIDEVAAGWRSQVDAARDEDRSGAAAAYMNMGRAFEGASRARESRVTRIGLDFIQGDAGYDEAGFQALKELPAGYSPEAQREAAGMVAELSGFVKQQGNMDADPVGVYQDFVEKGFSPRLAATAAYGEVGWRKPGAAESLLFGGVLGGAAGEAMAGSAGKKGLGKMTQALLKFGKVGGPIVGVGATIALASMYRGKADKMGADWDKGMQSELMGAARQQYGEERFQGFKKFLDESGPVQNSQELVNAISSYFEGNVLFGEKAGTKVGPAPERRDIQSDLDDLKGLFE